MPLDFSPAVFTPQPPAIFETAGQAGITTTFKQSESRSLSLSHGRTIAQPDESFQSQTTEIEAQTIDPVGAIVNKAAELWKRQLITKTHIEYRLRELHLDALRDAEPFSESSLADLRSFLTTLQLTERPSIFLLDNGNLRLLWRNDAKEQVGLQFLGDGVVQFVMFAQRHNPPIMSRIAGADVLSAIRRRIADNDSDRLLFG
jgi:hypothetical protein